MTQDDQGSGDQIDGEEPASVGERPAGFARWQAQPVLTSVRVALKALLPVAIIAGGVFGYRYLVATAPEPRRGTPTEQSFSVETVAVIFEELQPDLTLYGETTAGRTVDIRALVSGQVIEVGEGLREGGEVAAGDVLLRIDPFDYEGALVDTRARLEEARAKLQEFEASHRQETDALARDREQLALAERDLERASSLVRRGTLSERSVDDRKLIVAQRMQSTEQRSNNLAVWQARTAQQRATISRLEWTVRQAERRLRETELKAPFDAYVSDVGAEVGRIVSANDRVATLRARDRVDVRFNLSDSQYGRILAADGTLIGREAKVIWRIGDQPIAFNARIDRISATFTGASGGVTVIAALEDPLEPVAIRSGAFVEVRIKDRAYGRVARLPQTAIYGGSTVYVVEDGRLQPREVSVIGRAEGDALVRGAVEPGDRVMRTRLSAPGPGLKVEERDSARVSATRSQG